MTKSEMDAVRRIVREEIACALRTLAESARGLAGYDTDHIESVALTAVAQSADSAAGSLDHAPDKSDDARTEESPDGA